MEKLSEYLMTAEAAEMLGVSQNTLRTWADAGRLPMYRNPGNNNRMYKRAELEKYLKQAAKPVKPAGKKAR
jgi:excisionase family DNA binding protein